MSAEPQPLPPTRLPGGRDEAIEDALTRAELPQAAAQARDLLAHQPAPAVTTCPTDNPRGNR